MIIRERNHQGEKTNEQKREKCKKKEERNIKYNNPCILRQEEAA